MPEFKKAKRERVKMKLAITGPSGSGKSFSALKIARGLVGKEGRIAALDTENEKLSLYDTVTDFDVLAMHDPFTIDKFSKVVELATENKYDALIIDSASHAWVQLLKEKELLDTSGKGNSYTNWSTITKKHDDFINLILQSKINLIVTMRSKQDYSIEKNDKGKTQITKVGLAPVQRDGMEYEFITVFDMNMNHSCSVSKDSTALFDGSIFVPDETTGEKIAEWLKGKNDK